ncbi:hypothetical protein BLOT_006701 [Blomia tropicalis]|nr:hypothetical protein BLOT_006701 [Blomia tropicalis]
MLLYSEKHQHRSSTMEHVLRSQAIYGHSVTATSELARIFSQFRPCAWTRFTMQYDSLIIKLSKLKKNLYTEGQRQQINEYSQ